MPSDEFMASYAADEADAAAEAASAYGAGQFVGGIIGVAILTFVFRLVLKRFASGTNLVLASVGSAVAMSTFLYAFGSADGGPPRFGAGFAQYGIGGVVIMILMLWMEKNRRARNG